MTTDGDHCRSIHWHLGAPPYRSAAFSQSRIAIGCDKPLVAVNAAISHSRFGSTILGRRLPSLVSSGYFFSLKTPRFLSPLTSAMATLVTVISTTGGTGDQSGEGARKRIRAPRQSYCARFKASPRIETMSSIWDFSAISGGEKAMMSPVTRMSRPRSKQSTKTS